MAEYWDAVIIGGGHNGLLTAAYLARAGLRVLVLERRPVLGGASCTEALWPGYRVSTAAYSCSLLQERVIRELDLRRYGYRIYPRDPTFFRPHPDGSYFLLWQDMKKSCAEIARYSPNDADAYPLFEDHLERLARLVEKLLFVTPPDLARASLADLLRLGRLGWDWWRMEPAARVGELKIFSQSAAEFLDEWFESDQLKVTLATNAITGTFAGPRSPGTAYILLHHVMGKVNGHRGLWGYVRGGMGMVAEAIAASARAANASIRTNAEVDRILIRDARAEGVLLRNGAEIHARVIVSNADPKRTFLGLVGEKELEPEFVRQVRNIQMQGCVLKINLALDALPEFKAAPEIRGGVHRALIHICPSTDYLERAFDDAKYGRPSAQPFLEISIPTAYDDTLAPPGKHVMGIFLQYAPYDLKPSPEGGKAGQGFSERSGDPAFSAGSPDMQESEKIGPSGPEVESARDSDLSGAGGWPVIKDSYADSVMDLIEDYAPGFKSRILHRQVLSPLDLEETFGLTGGHIFHGEMLPHQLFALRPVPGWAAYRTPIRNLYLCGAGTHPGGGVMGAPGANAARAILHSLRRSLPK